MFFLSCSGLGECGLVALVSPLPPSSVCLSDWREGLGDASVLLPVGLGKTKDKASFKCAQCVLTVFTPLHLSGSSSVGCRGGRDKSIYTLKQIMITEQ